MKFKQGCMVLLACLLLAGCGGKTSEPKMQVASYPGWINVKVDETAIFQIPPTMEIQSDGYRKKVVDAAKDDPVKLRRVQKQQNLGTRKGNSVCQQIGLNDAGPGPAEQKNYARVKFVTMPLEGKGSVPTYGQPLGLNPSQINEYGEITKNGLMESERAVNPNVKFLKWEPMQSVIINGVECLHIAYEEQKGDYPVLQVDVYNFFNKDRVHTLTISYRVKDAEMWHAQGKNINDIVNTLQITKR